MLNVSRNCDPVEPTITPESICIPSKDVVSREIEGELIIVPIASGIGNAEDELYTLNETGRAIWQRLDGKRTLAEVAADLTDIYTGSPEQITRDVMGLATELARRKMINIR